MLQKYFLHCLLITTVYASGSTVISPIFHEQVENYTILVYENLGIKMQIRNSFLGSLLTSEFHPLKKTFLYPKKQNLKLITDMPYSDCFSTYDENKILYTDHAFQCVIVGGYCPDTKKRFIFHLNYFFLNNVRKREIQLYRKLSALHKKRKKCEIALLSGFYSPNVASALAVIRAAKCDVTYCNIKPLYMPNPLEPYYNKVIRLFQLSDTFDLTINNVIKGNRLAILPDGSFFRAHIAKKTLEYHRNILKKQLILRRKIYKNTKKVVKKIDQLFINILIKKISDFFF